MPTRADPAAPAPLERLIHDAGEFTTHGDKGLHSQVQQAATQVERGPSRPVEHMMLETAVGRLVQAHIAECSGYGAPPTGSQRANDPYLDFAPRRARKS